MTPSVAGVVLAAGASRRMGTPKQLLRAPDGRTLVAHAANELLDAGCSPVVVVVGADRDAVATALDGVNVALCVNDQWTEGMASSIRSAIAYLEGAFGDGSTGEGALSAVVIAACDMPSVTAGHIGALIRASNGGQLRVASRYPGPEGREIAGVPAVFPKADWSVLRGLTGDRGARVLLAEAGTLSVFLWRGNFDLDTPSDVAEWRAQPPFLQPAQPSMSMIAKTALSDLDHEVAQTRRMLSLVPADKLDFTPHAKSWPLGKLARHLTDFGMWGAVTLQTEELNFAEPMPPGPPMPTDAAGFVKLLDDNMAGFNTALASATDEQLMGTWTMKNGDAVIMAMPRVAVLRGMVINHMIHHRAQLTIYYRLLDIPVPGLYGPSADETQ